MKKQINDGARHEAQGTGENDRYFFGDRPLCLPGLDGEWHKIRATTQGCPSVFYFNACYCRGTAHCALGFAPRNYLFLHYLFLTIVA